MAGYLGNFGKHSLQANLRNDDSTQYGSRTTGAINYGYQITSEWRASAGVGTAFKAPTFNDLYYPLDPWGSFGTPGLKPEESRNRELALHWEKGAQHASATYYDNHVKNLIDWQPNINGPFSFSPVNVGKARLRGLTLAADGTVTDLLYRASIDLQKAEDESTGNLLDRRARQHGSLWLGKTFGNLELGSEIIASGHRYNDAENDIRLAGYTLVNLTASYHLARDWTINARVNNLFDRDYVLATTASSGSPNAPAYNTSGMNAFVGLRWQPNY
jgi:vitamin B12 transporter